METHHWEEFKLWKPPEVWVFKNIFILFMCVMCESMPMSAGVHSGQKRALDPLEMELQALARSQVLCKSRAHC